MAREPNTPSGADTIRFLQWNICGYSNKASLLQAAANIDNIHVILLQETLLTREDIRFSGYHVFALPRSETTRGSMILIHASLPCSPIQDPIPCGDGVESLAVRLHLPEETIDVYNIYRHPTRATLDIGELCAAAEGGGYIIGGDFNAHHPLLHSVSRATPQGSHIAEILDDCPGVTLLNNGEPTHVRGGRLDLTMASASLTDRLTWGIHASLLSDHFALSFNLRLVTLPPAAPPPPTWRIRDANWPLFQATLAQWAASYTPQEDDIDLLEAHFSSAVTAAATTAIPQTRANARRHRDFWYYNEEIKEANHWVNILRRAFRRNRTPESLANLRDAVQEARETAHRVRVEKWREWCAEFGAHTSIGELWAKLRIATSRATPRHTHQDPEGEAHRLAAEFAGRSLSTSLPLEVQHELEGQRPSRERLINIAAATPDVADTPFSIEELHAALKKSSDTAPGHDRITYSMVSHLGQEGEEAFLQLVNTSWTMGRLPTPWKQADIVPIPKPRERGKYRPISLLSCLAKTMERMVLRRLLWRLGALPENVHGFTKGKSTAHSIASLLTYLQQGSAVVVFLDLEKAFEIASPVSILTALAEKGINGYMLRWLQDYFHGRSARVKFQGHLSTYHRLENGTPQGGVLSPTLFNILMVRLLDTPLPNGTHLISYADDVALVVTGAISRATRAQTALDRLSHRCAALGLKISTSKTKAMVTGKSLPYTRLYVQGQPIDWVTSHLYLGVWIDSRLSFRPEVAYLRRRLRARVNAMRSLASTDLGTNYGILRTFYTSAIRPVLEYPFLALAGMAETRWAELETVQNEALRIMLGAPRWTLVTNMLLETGLQPLQHRIQTLAACFAAKILQARAPTPLQGKLLAAMPHDREVFPQRTWVDSLVDCIASCGLIAPLLHKGRDGMHPEYTPPPPWDPPLADIHIMPQRKTMPRHTLQEQAEAVLDRLNTGTAAVYYTDGSLDPITAAAGAAFVLQGRGHGVRVTGTRCSTQVEAVALRSALSHALQQQDHRDVVIHTDSQALLNAIRHEEPRDNVNLLSTILHQLSQLRAQGRRVVLNWVPGHIGIPGNEAADAAARAAASRPGHQVIDVAPSRAELAQAAKVTMRKRSTDHLRRKSPERRTAQWYRLATAHEPAILPARCSRGDETRVFRLRLGYHSKWQVLHPPPEGESICPHCDEGEEATLTHYIAQCPATAFLRPGPPTSPEGYVRRLSRSCSRYILDQLASTPPPR